VKLIPVIRSGYEGIEKFVDEVNECEAILSSSLHGLIVSHAYGVPATWCDITNTKDSIAGDGTKFLDYMMSVGIKTKSPIKIKKGSTISLSYAKRTFDIPKKQINLDKLLSVAPFDKNEPRQKGVLDKLRPAKARVLRQAKKSAVIRKVYHKLK
jgi:hypothetical protein